MIHTLHRFECNACKKTKILTAPETDGRGSSTADGKSSSSGVYKCYNVFCIYGNSVIQCKILTIIDVEV